MASEARLRQRKDGLSPWLTMSNSHFQLRLRRCAGQRTRVWNCGQARVSMRAREAAGESNGPARPATLRVIPVSGVCPTGATLAQATPQNAWTDALRRSGPEKWGMG